MNTVIRRAAPEDIPALVGLLRLLFSIEKDFVFDAAKQECGLWLLLTRAQSAVFAAEQDGQVIGMCTGQLLISTAQGGLSALVEDVAVQPDHQGKGIGRRLVAAAEAWAVSQGASRMQLLADQNNEPALAFYHKTGLQRTAMICLRKML